MKEFCSEFWFWDSNIGTKHFRMDADGHVKSTGMR
jgi:hypothetical protein